MEPEIVKNYVKKIEKLQPKYVLLRNLKEAKQSHKEGQLGVETPILSEDYIKFFESYVLLETLFLLVILLQIIFIRNY